MIVKLPDTIGYTDSIDLGYVPTVQHLFTKLERVIGFGALLSLHDYVIMAIDITEENKPVVLQPIFHNIDLSNYTLITIFPIVKGELPLAAIAATILETTGAFTLAGSLAGGLSAELAFAMIDTLVFVMQVGIAIGVGALMQAIAPTQTTNDAKKAQTRESNLWNGGQATMEEGGALPMVFGTPHCGGGTVISTSLTTYARPVNPNAKVDPEPNPLTRNVTV